MLTRIAFAAVLFANVSPLAAQTDLALAFPVDCALGQTCFLQQFMDRDPGPGFRAFDCGPQSYDGHTGTDIRVADFEAMEAGVTVIAAADGVVRALRNGVPDGGTATAEDGQGCGNGVVLTHPGGWETQYCHLMEGSISVAQGDEVTTGTPLGQIGYSGFTDFPHVEFLVRQNGNPVDPFDPSDLAQCGVGTLSLWHEQDIPVSPGGILSVGFSDGVPEFDAIKAGTADAETLAADGTGLVLWGFVYGARAGDQLAILIEDEAGQDIHRNLIDLDRTQAQLFRASGRRTPDGGWAPGLYTGSVALTRGGEIVTSRTTTIRVD